MPDKPFKDVILLQYSQDQIMRNKYHKFDETLYSKWKWKKNSINCCFITLSYVQLVALPSVKNQKTITHRHTCFRKLQSFFVIQPLLVNLKISHFYQRKNIKLLIHNVTWMFCRKVVQPNQMGSTHILDIICRCLKRPHSIICGDIEKTK